MAMPITRLIIQSGRTLTRVNGKVTTNRTPSDFHYGRLYRNCSYESAGGRSSKWQRLRQLPIVRYLKSLRWTPIPLSVGFALIAYQQYRHIRERENRKNKDNIGPILASDWEVQCYRMLPLKTFSRVWGWVNNIDLPVWARRPILSLYVKSFGCDLSEAVEEDLKQYRNLGEFFRRAIKAAVRPIDFGNCVVSPADGKVMHYGQVVQDHLEQVKGVTYSLQTFLGPNSWQTHSQIEKVPDDVYQKSLLHNPDNCLYHCIVYLAPGDYHRFHSPVNWEVQFRRHFSGELLSVRPSIARRIAGLISLNERAVYIGKWHHGFFSLSAVGATNVGSMKVIFDKDLSTNVKGWKKGTHHEHSFLTGSSGIQVKKGDFFGEFNLGSTVVLIFEAPSNFSFKLRTEQKIRVGQSLNHCMDEAIDGENCAIH